MKKTLIVFVLAIACAFTFNIQNSSAYYHNPDEISPGSKVVTAAHHDFPQAKKVVWTQKGKEFVAKFNSEAGKVTATYDKKGQLLSTLINSNGQHMPFNIRTELAKKYPGFVSQNMTGYISPSEHCYYILLKQKSDNLVKWMRVKCNGTGNIDVLQKLQQKVKV